MAIRTPNSSGNYNTAATWDTVAFITTPSFNTTAITTAGILTEVFTAPNTTNAITGCWILLAQNGQPAAGRDWTLEIVESGVTVGTLATFAQADFPSNNPAQQWIYFRFPSSYTYTTVAAGAYRFRLRSTVANSGQATANGAATGLSILPTDNRNVVPLAADQIWVGAHNGTTQIDVTVDGTAGVCNGGVAGAGGTVIRTIARHAIYLGGSAGSGRARLIFDTAASSALSYSGDIVVADGGSIVQGSPGSPYPAGQTAFLTTPVNNNNAQAIYTFGTGFVTMEGQPLTYPTTTYASGLGTAASPLIVADPVDWNVGDKIVVAATNNGGTNYNESEVRFIITKNSTTSYVVSSTLGGGENALAFAHSTSAIVVNCTRNVGMRSSLTAGSRCLGILFELATQDNSSLQWANLNNMGTLGGTPALATNSVYGVSVPVGRSIPIDNCVFDEPNAYGFMDFSATARTHTGLIVANGGAFSNLGTCAGLGVAAGAVNQTFVNPIFINMQRQAVEYRGVNCVFTNPTWISCNKAGVANQGGFQPINGGPFTMTTPNAHANRLGAFALNSSVNSTITAGLIGTKGANGSDVLVAPNSANTNVLFDGVTFPTAPTVTGHTTGAIGATEILFNKINTTANRHMWYSEYGSAQSTGAGLPDSTVRTPGTLNVRIAPENSATGFQYEYLVLAVPGKAVQSFLFVQKNAAFSTDVVTVELFLPGSTVADATTTVSNVIGSYNVYGVAANYLGTESLYARVRVTAKTVTPSAYIYLADISNGTNNIINFNTWYRGKPSTIMFDQLGDPAGVWAQVLDGGFTAQGLMRLFASVLAGKVSGAGTGTEIFRDLADTKPRITATVDVVGNRTAITRDAT